MNWIERVCNKLPPPAIIFMFLFLIIAVLSVIFHFAGVHAVNPATGQDIAVKSFFSKEGLYWLLRNMIPNFVSFAPLGLVLVMTVAVGFCEESGLLVRLLHDKMRRVPVKALPYLIAFIGILGNIASDTAVIVIPPLAGFLYLAAGRHPVAGIICGYAGVQAGFGANLIIAGTDGLLQTITQKAADDFIGEGVLKIDITCNWYFMAASTLLCTLVIGFVCSRLEKKRFSAYTPPEEAAHQEMRESTPQEKKALRWAGISVLIYLAVIAALTIWGPLGVIVGAEEEGRRGFVGSYLLTYLITLLVFMFTIPGIVYGRVSGAFGGIRELTNVMGKIVSRMSGYIVFCFFAAQFQSLFSWTGLDTMMAVGGAKLLNSTGFTGFPMIVCFILMSAFINIFISSGSAKWTLLAPAFVPMLIMAGGYHPAMTQLFYRIGDSPTNAFTPVSPYLWINLKTAQDQYDPNLKAGTMISNLIPVAIVLLVAWIAFLGIWMLIGLPIGPGVTAVI